MKAPEVNYTNNIIFVFHQNDEEGLGGKAGKSAFSSDFKEVTCPGSELFTCFPILPSVGSNNVQGAGFIYFFFLSQESLLVTR